MDLEGRVAVITGASRGLGAGLAESFARAGLRLGLCARSAPALPASDRVWVETLDVCDAQAVERFAARTQERLGPIALWINNAGELEPVGPARDASPEAFARTVSVNLLGVFHGARAFVHQLRAHGSGGTLINISSGAARNAYSGWAAYCASKAGVDRLTECLQLEEADTGLRAYSVAPGVIETRMQERVRSTPREAFPALDKFLEIHRRSLFNTPEFVADHLLALAFDPERAPSSPLVSLPSQHARQEPRETS